MKKAILAFAGVALLAGSASAQSQRMVLLEHFTQASCGPCATYNPAMQTLIDNPSNDGKITSIKYQTSWPGTDPMNAHNPTQVQTRVTYYNVTGVPNSVLDGDYYNDHPANWGQSDIDTRYAVASPCDINLSHSLSPNRDSIYVDMQIVFTQNLTATDLRAHIAVVEKKISFPTPPGSNGETEFHNVMKRMLPTDQGTTLNSTYNAGDTVNISQAWKLANVYDDLQLRVVAFLQDNTSQEVYQAAETQPLPPAVAYDVMGVSLTTPKEVCSEYMGGDIYVQNRGNETVTKLTINYTINDSTYSTVWTGSIAPLDYETITIDPALYNIKTSGNAMSVTVTDPNDSTDVNPSDNSASSTFQVSDDKLYSTTVYFELDPDNWPQEITWELVDESGTQLYSGGPYSNTTPIYRTFNLSDLNCYTFGIYDSYGDGLSDGGGYYSIYVMDPSTGDPDIIYYGVNYGDEDVSAFTIDESLAPAVDGVSSVLGSHVSVYPNPAKSVVNIDLGMNMDNATISLMNVLGEVVMAEQIVASDKVLLNVQDVNNGTYFVKITSENGEIFTEKVIIE